MSESAPIVLLVPGAVAESVRWDPMTERPNEHDTTPAAAGDLIPSHEITEAIAALSALADAGVEVDGELQVAESTWVIYGHTTYDGEVIVGEYHDAVEASEVLRAVTLPQPDDDLPLA